MSVAAAMPAMRRPAGMVNGAEVNTTALPYTQKRTRYHRKTPVSPTPVIMHTRAANTRANAGACAGGRSWSNTWLDSNR